MESTRDGNRGNGPARSGDRGSTARRGWRPWAFRLAAAVVVPAATIGLLETGLRLAGVGQPTAFTRPCRVGNVASRCDNAAFAWQYFPKEIARTPVAFAFPERKPPGVRRIFVIGGSAAQGDPEPSFGFSRFLEAALADRYPAVRFEVVNAAMTAVNSHVMLPVVRHLARHEPDLFLVYMGNNEVVGPYGAGTIFSPPVRSRNLIRASLAARGTRIGQLLGRALQPVGGGGAPEEWRGMEMFVEHRVPPDDPRLDLVYAHFEDNLRDLVDVAAGSGAAVALSTVGTNLRDNAPFADGTDGRAVAAYLAGASAWREGDREAACAEFETALDLDALRFRADRRINRVVRAVAGEARSPSVVLVDGEAALRAAADSGCPGFDLFLDHVHPNFRGNRVLAEAFLPAVERALGLEPPAQGPRGSARSEEWYAQRLAHSGYDFHRTMTEMRRRMSRPPFTAQTDHAERLDTLERVVEDLARFTSPEGLAASDALYRAAERLRPDDPWIRFNHGVLLSDLSLSDQAAHAFRAFLRTIPHDVPAREKLSVALASGGRFEEALRVCEELNREQPDFDPPYYTRAYALARLGRYEDSLAVYRDMLDRDPEEAPRIWREIGNLLTRLGRETEAREAFRRGDEATGRE